MYQWDCPRSRAANDAKGESMIEVKEVSLFKKRKKAIQQVLSRISLSFSPGEISLFLGRSGAGKSMLLRSVAQLEQEYVGQILYQGRDLREMSRRERCQVVGFVPQGYALFPFMNVLDNCIHPLCKVLQEKPSSAKEKAWEMLSTLQMTHLSSAYPHELSGGQQQRVAVVRALLLDPACILLDEPTSALDPENAGLLIQMVMKLRERGTGIVVATHDMTFAEKIYDRIFFIEGGKLVESLERGFADNPFSFQTRLERFFATADKS